MVTSIWIFPVHLKPRNKDAKVLIAVVTMTMMKKVATPQHGGGHVAIDNRAGCRHVQTRGRPVHQQGLRR